MIKTAINSPDFAKPLGAYSHGYSIDLGTARLIYTTGQIALDSKGNVVFPNDVAKQTEFVFESLQKILIACSASMDDVVKATIYVTSMKDFAIISPIRNRYLNQSKPVSTLVEVSALVKPECKVEVEVVAVVPLDSFKN